MAQAKREPDGYERLIAALRAFADPARATQEKRYQKSSWEHWGVALPKMDAAIRATVADLGQRASLAFAASAVARAGVGSQDRRRTAAGAQMRRA